MSARTAMAALLALGAWAAALAEPTANATPNANPNATATSTTTATTTRTATASPLPAAVAPASLPPVTPQLFRLEGKLEVQPLLLLSIGDPFYRTAALGMRLERHLDERWSLGLHLMGGSSSVSAPIELCGSAACSITEGGRLRGAPGNLVALAGLELGWAPIYGKLSLLGEKTIHFDAYVSAGPELLRERIAPDAASAVSGRWAVGGRIALGERVFLSRRLMVRVAASEVLYPARVRGRQELSRKLAVEGGISWLFGDAP